MNQATQVSRPMRRRPKAGTLTPGSGAKEDYTSSPMPGTSAPKRYKWQFMDEHKKWINYGQVSSGNDPACVVAATSADIEKEFAKNPKSVIQIQSQSHQYQLDFSTMKQTNLQTQVSRDVRRIVEKPSRNFSALNLIDQEESDDEFPSNEYEWFFCDENNQWIKYGQISSGNDTNCVPTQGSDDIEKHYKTKPGQVMTIKSRQQTYVLDLTTMTQTNVRTRVQRPMRRKVREVRRQKQFGPMAGGSHGSSSTSASTTLFTEIPFGQTSYATPIRANHAEYGKVLSLLRSTNCQPRNIFKVKNPHLKAAFDIKKAQLQSQYPGVRYREEYLFHGTNSVNVKAILEENIDWRLHGSNAGQNQGRGAYFSNNAQFSRGYGEVIFICKVLVGLTAPGNAQTVKPPKDGYVPPT
ncbi:protein mono-ADP-ribosyltransferase PARP11-like [Hyalella azteca]|uniref:Poly [ADP-ribose] polymerase n=1 Tax=Hyalella azteca TaxID=294128 RepID=A0A979FMM5_HYAAZ|nr:protein mono-ADP-ribosyltransferase PARP11-like [Hyalella azteca]